MDFLEHLVRKSEIINNNTEYFNYKQPVKRQRHKTNTAQNGKSEYTSLNDNPLVSSYVVFDFETTGLNPSVNAIVEIGAVKVIDNVVQSKFTTLVNPKQYIPMYLSQKIHITNEMISDKPDISLVLPGFADFIEDLPLVAHNAGFDMSFLLANCKRLDIQITNPVIDTLYLSRHYLKECKKHNLEYLANYYNITLNNAHRAYFDAKATQQLFEIIKEKISVIE
jgi:DNA polymerase-3 subunit alpha (Gram-positive type)